MNTTNPFLQQPAPEGKFKIGLRYGAVLMIGGMVVVGINVLMLYMSDRYFPKLLAAGMAMVLAGPVFMLFPGRPVAERPAVKDMAKVLMANAPVGYKIAWIVWGIISLAIAIVMLFQFDPDFMA
jgi:hypothetical protein